MGWEYDGVDVSVFLREQFKENDVVEFLDGGYWRKGPILEVNAEEVKWRVRCNFSGRDFWADHVRPSEADDLLTLSHCSDALCTVLSPLKPVEGQKRKSESQRIAKGTSFRFPKRKSANVMFQVCPEPNPQTVVANPNTGRKALDPQLPNPRPKPLSPMSENGTSKRPEPQELQESRSQGGRSTMLEIHPQSQTTNIKP